MQVSKKKLSAVVQQRALIKMLPQFRVVKTPDDADALLNALLTRNEKEILLRRMTIADMLEAGVSYREVKRILSVSGSTISNVRDFLEKRGYGRNPNRKRMKKDDRNPAADKPRQERFIGYYQSKQPRNIYRYRRSH